MSDKLVSLYSELKQNEHLIHYNFTLRTEGNHADIAITLDNPRFGKADGWIEFRDKQNSWHPQSMGEQYCINGSITGYDDKWYKRERSIAKYLIKRLCELNIERNEAIAFEELKKDTEHLLTKAYPTADIRYNEWGDNKKTFDVTTKKGTCTLSFRRGTEGQVTLDTREIRVNDKDLESYVCNLIMC